VLRALALLFFLDEDTITHCIGTGDKKTVDYKLDNLNVFMAKRNKEECGDSNEEECGKRLIVEGVSDTPDRFRHTIEGLHNELKPIEARLEKLREKSKATANAIDSSSDKTTRAKLSREKQAIAGEVKRAEAEVQGVLDKIGLVHRFQLSRITAQRTRSPLVEILSGGRLSTSLRT